MSLNKISVKAETFRKLMVFYNEFEIIIWQLKPTVINIDMACKNYQAIDFKTKLSLTFN